MYRFFHVNTDESGRQTDLHGTTAYPAALYSGNLNEDTVVWHWHDELELVYVWKGSFTVGAGRAVETLPEGSGCFINAGVLHSVWKAETEECEYRSVVFHPRLIGSMDSVFWQRCVQPFAEPGAPQCIRIDGGDSGGKALLGLLNLAWESELLDRSGYEIEMRYALTKLLAALSDASLGSSRRLTKRELRDMERMKRMLNFIESHFSEEITARDIAASAAVSECECMRCFRRSIGSPPIQYVKEYRIRRAEELLRSSGMSVSEIAGICGFLDLSYFAKTFRQMNGMTPSEYRKTGAGVRKL